MSVQIVDANEQDVEGLIEIYSSPHLYHTREAAAWFVKCFFDYHHIKVLRHNEKVVGATFWNVKEEKHHGLAEIAELWIDEDFRRKGLGEKLLRAMIDDIRQYFTEHGHSLRKVVVTTGEDNGPARKLYEKAGFQNCAVLRDLFGQGENELVYIMTVNP
jgi:ribosomal protein S18 acetylase RimI-like enzyme